jgi:uncharacterized protein with HEPN domain
MLSSAAIAALRDIAHHIDLAAHFAASFDYDTFRADPRAVYAVTRRLEIISEASRRLAADLKANASLPLSTRDDETPTRSRPFAALVEGDA